MTQQATRKKVAAFYALTLVLSLAVALAIVEIVLRQLAFTSATDLGSRAQQRWYAQYWRPFNEMVFRDLPLAGRLDRPEPRLYFLGDSFTAGAGVAFEDSYFFQVAWQPNPGYNAFNLGRPGASTRQELATLRDFDARTGGHARVVVHQYFSNDIEDYIDVPAWTPPPALKAAARHLDTAELLLAWHFNTTTGGRVNDALRAAYTTPATLAKHRRDLAALHDEIRAQGGRVVFLVFPGLNSDAILQETGAVVAEMRRFFAATCRPGDRFVDATVSARQLSERARIVSTLDPHPSPALHRLVAQQLRQALAPAPLPAGQPRLHDRCEDLHHAP